MTVLMTTNYADGRHRGQTGEQGRQERGRERGLGMAASPPSLSVLLQEAASLSVGRSASGHEWLMLLNAGTLAVAPSPSSVGLAARCSRTVDFNFPRKSLRCGMRRVRRTRGGGKGGILFHFRVSRPTVVFTQEARQTDVSTLSDSKLTIRKGISELF